MFKYKPAVFGKPEESPGTAAQECVRHSSHHYPGSFETTL